MKKYKLKKKVFFLGFIFLLAIGSGVFFISKRENFKINSPINHEEPKKEEDGKQNNKPVEDHEDLKKATYYIDEYLERYLAYLNSNPNQTVDEVIRSVNANIDYDFYTHVVASKLEDDFLILVNKYHQLDSDYAPKLVKMESRYSMVNAYMEETAYQNYKKMVDAAAKEGIKLYNVSAYRSYATQNTLYTNYKKRDGEKMADTYSARAGFSEHQTGLASDINTSSRSAHFENTKEFEWLQKNAYQYGFILRYPEGKEYLTGYVYEPWHYRYVGEEVAQYIHEHSLTYEEYYAYFIENKN